jgi:hypothetical protein
LATALQNADDTPESAYVSTGDEPPLSKSIDRQIDTVGGSYYEGSIDTGGGNFVGHDYIVQEKEERRTKLFRNCGISVLVVLLGLVFVAICTLGGGLCGR